MLELLTILLPTKLLLRTPSSKQMATYLRTCKATVSMARGIPFTLFYLLSDLAIHLSLLEGFPEPLLTPINFLDGFPEPLVTPINSLPPLSPTHS